MMSDIYRVYRSTEPAITTTSATGSYGWITSPITSGGTATIQFQPFGTGGTTVGGTTGIWTTPSTSTNVGEMYEFEIEQKGKLLIATDNKHHLRVMAKSRRILEQKCNEIVSMLSGSLFGDRYLTIWGTHNDKTYSRKL